jgi:hypothetical protein
VRRTRRLIVALICLGMAAGCGQGLAAAPRSGGVATASVPGAAAGGSGGSTRAAAGGKRADLLYGVSCAGRECIAVGGYYGSAGAEHTLVERWAGGAWRTLPSPDAGRFRYSSLLGVSCPAATSCVAVGSPVIVWNGARWRVTAGASPFTAVSCPAAGLCMAVGQTERGAPAYGAWNGGAWHTGTLPVPRHSGELATVAGVSCPSPRFCLAVGDYSYGATARPSSGGYRDRILAEAWNGRSWRLLPTVNVGPVDQLGAVSCTSPGNCWAVGEVGRQFPLAEHWNGTAWRARPAPAPGRIGYTQLTGVACPLAEACMAVGSYQGMPIAESWTGGAWRLLRLPSPPGGNGSSQLNGVSCGGATACMAVGVSGRGLTYAERYDGTRWQLATTQNPA